MVVKSLREPERSKEHHVNFTMQGLTLLPFIDAARDAEPKDLLEVLKKNNKGILNAEGDFIDFESFEPNDDNLEEAVQSTLLSLSSPVQILPADLTFKLARDLTDVAANIYEKPSDILLHEIGEKAVNETAPRSLVILGITAAELIRKVPRISDRYAQVMLMFNQIEKKFSDYILIDTVIGSPGNAGICYSYLPGSEHLANETNIHFNIGTLKGIPKLLNLKLKKKPEITIKLGDFPVRNIFGDSLNLSKKPSVKTSLKVDYDIRGDELFIDHIHCGNIDKNGVVKFTKDVDEFGRAREFFIQRSTPLFRQGWRYHLEEELYSYMLNVSYELDNPKSGRGRLKNFLDSVYLWVGKKFNLGSPDVEVIMRQADASAHQEAETHRRLNRAYFNLHKIETKLVLTEAELSRKEIDLNGADLELRIKNQEINSKGEQVKSLESGLSVKEKELGEINLLLEIQQKELKETIKKFETQTVEMEKTNAQLLKQKKELENAEILGERAILARGVTHDMANLLTPIIMYLSNPPSLLESINDVREAMDRYNNLFSSLRSTLRGEQEPKQEILLENFLDKEIRILPNIRGYKGKIDVSFPTFESSSEKMYLPIYCAPIAMQQIMHNLVGNAMDSNAKNIFVKLGLEFLTREACEQINQDPRGIFDVYEGYHAVLSIRDDGEGISKEYEPKIFQFGVSSKGGAERGIGLAVTKARARREDICIRFDSRSIHDFPEDPGTEFKVLTKIHVDGLYFPHVKKQLGLK